MPEWPAEGANWGRWGVDDERGALNLVTAEVVRAAVGLVRHGRVYSLALPIRRKGVPNAPGRNPALLLMTLDGGDYAADAPRPGGCQGADGYLLMNTGGTTHIDTPAHIWYGDRLFNGFSANEVSSVGSRRCGAEKIGGVITRGVLLDVPALLGVEHLEQNHVITPDELEACATAEGVTLSPGDAVLVRTGWLKVFEDDPDYFYSYSRELGICQPGVGLEAATWLAEREPSIVGNDTVAFEVMPAEDALLYAPYNLDPELPSFVYAPVHMELIRNRGIYIMELLNLDDLARDCVFEFMFVVAPLNIVGGAESPLNPLAVI